LAVGSRVHPSARASRKTCASFKSAELTVEVGGFHAVPTRVQALLCGAEADAGLLELEFQVTPFLVFSAISLYFCVTCPVREVDCCLREGVERRLWPL
jgi:hypothetical protein